MKTLLTFIVSLLVASSGMAQETKMDTVRTALMQTIAVKDSTNSVYKNLPIKKFYNVSTGTKLVDEVLVYTVNDSVVRKEVYDKYARTWKNMANCKPCVLISYDINDVKIRKAVQYTDCLVGYFIDYYPNGNVKIIGHYKENGTGDWNNLSDRGYCKRDGVWKYFDEQGNLVRTETWKDGTLLN